MNSSKVPKLLNESEILLSDGVVNRYKQRQFLLAGAFIIAGLANCAAASVAMLWFASLNPSRHEAASAATVVALLIVAIVAWSLGTYSMGAGHSAVYLYTTVIRALLQNLEYKETNNGNRNENEEEGNQQADR